MTHHPTTCMQRIACSASNTETHTPSDVIWICADRSIADLEISALERHVFLLKTACQGHLVNSFVSL